MQNGCALGRIRFFWPYRAKPDSILVYTTK
jgi:hypothetical protein